MKTILIDTNILLRFLLNDVPSQAEQVKLIFRSARSGKTRIRVDAISIFEIEFALHKYYTFPKTTIRENLSAIVGADFLSISDREIFFAAINYYDRFSVSFVDCFLLAKAQSESLELQSFDHKLMSTWKEINRL